MYRFGYRYANSRANVLWFDVPLCDPKNPQKPLKIRQKSLAKIFDKNPAKIWWDKNFYIFLNIQTNKTQ